MLAQYRSDVSINTTHMAEPSIQAGAWGAVINVDITVCPCPPHNTVTLVPIHHILKNKHPNTTKYTDSLKAHTRVHEYTINI